MPGRSRLSIEAYASAFKKKSRMIRWRVSCNLVAALALVARVVRGRRFWRRQPFAAKAPLRETSASPRPRPEWARLIYGDKKLCSLVLPIKVFAIRCCTLRYDPIYLPIQGNYLFERSMSHSVELIVNGYVRLNDRDALQALLAHRRELLRQLKSVTGVDPRQAVAQVSQEIAVIEAGLATIAPE